MCHIGLTRCATRQPSARPDLTAVALARVQGTPEGVEDNGSLTRVAAFPIGIDPERFARALDRTDVKAHIAQLLNRYAGRKARPRHVSKRPREAFGRAFRSAGLRVLPNIVGKEGLPP